LLQKKATYESGIIFDPNLPDIGDLEIPHVIFNINKLFKLFYTIHYDKVCSISITKNNIAHEYGYATN
jgi:hypothetical protein